MRIPDYAEVITGWRGWVLSPAHNFGQLLPVAMGSPTTNDTWLPLQVSVARCVRTRGPASPSQDTCPHCQGSLHEVPVLGCHCGLWAFKTRELLESHLAISADHAVGEVALWGKLIEHEHGYRARFAYPTKLWADERHHAALQAYGVPVLPKADGPQLTPAFSGAMGATGISFLHAPMSYAAFKNAYLFAPPPAAPPDPPASAWATGGYQIITAPTASELSAYAGTRLLITPDKKTYLDNMASVIAKTNKLALSVAKRLGL